MLYSVHYAGCLLCTVECPNFATFSFNLLPRYTDVLWELHINCQSVKMIGQANITLKIFKLLPWLPWKQKRVAK